MSKHVFWQALVVSLIIFWAGIMIGILFENSRADTLTQVYFDSETDIFDIMLQQNMLSDGQLSCDSSIAESRLFADRIYYEAKELEKYDSSTKLTDEIINLGLFIPLEIGRGQKNPTPYFVIIDKVKLVSKNHKILLCVRDF